jgi:PAS domain S-box-containing protein
MRLVPMDTAGPSDSVLAALIEAIPDTVIVLDAFGRLKWGNGAAKRMFNRSLEDSIDFPALDLVHPDDLEFVLRSLASVQGKQTGTLIEVRVKTSTGWRLVEVIGSPVSWQGEDAVLFCLRDLTDRRRFEIARNEEARLRSLVQSAAAITIFVTANGLVESVSGAISRLLGHDPELVVHRPLAELVVEEDRAKLAEAFENASQSESASEPVTLDVMMLRYASSTTVAFELTLVNLTDDPTVGGFVVSAHDIRSRIAAECEQKETLSLLSASLNATDDGIIVVDSSRRATIFNRRFAEMWHLPERVLSGIDSVERLELVREQLVSPAEFERGVEEIYADPESESRDLVEFKDGRIFERSSKPSRVDGITVGRVWTFHDITQQKRMEEELLESVQRFGQVFKQGPLGIALVDLAFQITEVNDALCKLLEHRREDFIGSTFETFTHPDDAEKEHDLVRQMASGTVPTHQTEVRFVTRSGESVFGLVTASLIRNDLGKPMYGLLIVEDVSRRKRLERELVAHAATAVKLLASFTSREIEILQLLSEAETASKMAEHLSVSVRTVESHLANAYRKLGVRTREDAVAEFARLTSAVAGLERDFDGNPLQVLG